MFEEIEQDDAVLIIDASVEAKPNTNTNEVLQWHFNHTEEHFSTLTAFFPTLKY